MQTQLVPNEILKTEPDSIMDKKEETRCFSLNDFIFIVLYFVYCFFPGNFDNFKKNLNRKNTF